MKRQGGIPFIFESAGLSQVADIQLWLAPLKWSDQDITMPVYAAKCKSVTGDISWVLWCALSVSDAVLRSTRKYLLSNGALPLDSTWIVRGDLFPCGMVKADGVTPSYYLSMDALVSGKQNTAEPFPDDFAREVFIASGIADWHTFKAVWSAIQNVIPRWLIRSLKPVDFGYFKVHCIPYRKNWSINLIAAFPNLRNVISVVGRKKWKMIVPQLREAMFNTKQIELHEGDKHPYFGWTLEVVPSKPFVDFVTAVETTRSQAYPGEQYIKQWGAIIGRLQPQIEEILFYATKKLSHASAAVRRDGQSGSPGFRPLLAPGSIRKEDTDRIDGPIVVSNPVTHIAGEADCEIAIKSFKHMPTVSFVRRNDRHMR